jgi:hypothetical protein
MLLDGIETKAFEFIQNRFHYVTNRLDNIWLYKNDVYL